MAEGRSSPNVISSPAASGRSCNGDLPTARDASDGFTKASLKEVFESTCLCNICQRPPRDAVLCPHCSRFFCSDCHRSRAQCAYCLEAVSADTMIKCLWIEDMITQIQAALNIDWERGNDSRTLANEYLEKIADALRCPVCYDTVLDAHLCPHCSKMFCGRCVKVWVITRNKSCPCCVKQLTEDDLILCHWGEHLGRIVDKLLGKPARVLPENEGNVEQRQRRSIGSVTSTWSGLSLNLSVDPDGSSPSDDSDFSSPNLVIDVAGNNLNGHSSDSDSSSDRGFPDLMMDADENNHNDHNLDSSDDENGGNDVEMPSSPSTPSSPSFSSSTSSVEGEAFASDSDGSHPPGNNNVESVVIPDEDHDQPVEEDSDNPPAFDDAQNLDDTFSDLPENVSFEDSDDGEFTGEVPVSSGDERGWGNVGVGGDSSDDLTSDDDL